MRWAMVSRIAGLAVLPAVLALQTVGAAQTVGATDGGGAVPQMVLSIQPLTSAGFFGGEARVLWTLDREHPSQLRVSGGSTELPDVCAIGSGNEFQTGALVGWLLEARLLRSSPDGARVHVRWSRTVLRPGVIAGGDMHREFEVGLTEGHLTPIDLVRPIVGQPSGCDGVVVQMGLEYADSPSLKSELLDYDIWLVHHEADGREVLDRSGSRALQGEQVRYLFRPLRYDEQGMPSADGGVSMEFGGWLRGRVRPDGLIDLSLGAHRTVTKNRLGNGEHGNKTATIGDGDTLEVELPPYTWDGTNQRQRTSVRVTARRIR
jgi:hypothetical protein